MQTSAEADAEGRFASPGEPTEKLYLFSVDLEDIRSIIPDGEQYRERVPANTDRLLAFLADIGMKATFFATGDVARRYPELIRDILASGHELGCHTSDHLPLDRHTPESFRDDIKHCLDDFADAGGESCSGFRAPIGSLIKETRWAYEILRELGFTYSSSVLPAASPLYGWPDFGPDIPQVVDGMWEIPPGLSRFPKLKVPFGGGVYFRVLPMAIIRVLAAQRSRSGFPVGGYLHPYDIDTEQERFMHPELGESRFYNWLMYLNRGRVLSRAQRLIDDGYRIIRYDEYVEQFLEARPRLHKAVTPAAMRAGH
jgi:polysaccharide deacetylase family protein (PEP-CTERM system associated)